MRSVASHIMAAVLEAIAATAVGVVYAARQSHDLPVIGGRNARSDHCAAFEVAFDHHRNVGKSCDESVARKEISAVYAVG